jgi:integrase
VTFAHGYRVTQSNMNGVVAVADSDGVKASELIVDDIAIAGPVTEGDGAAAGIFKVHSVARAISKGDLVVHPIGGKEMRALWRLQREAKVKSLYVFISERGAPLSVAGYQRMVARAGVAAKFRFLVHSHMLRHSCGYKLANDGQDTRAIQGYLGHRSIMSTQRYTALAPDRFKRFWKD